VVKLDRRLDTLPERLLLAKARCMSQADFLELVLSDEITRIGTNCPSRARVAGGGLHTCCSLVPESRAALDLMCRVGARRTRMRRRRTGCGSKVYALSVQAVSMTAFRVGVTNPVIGSRPEVRAATVGQRWSRSI
jgi:hypothetical protein